MRIKLNEAVKPIKTYARDLDSRVIPSLEGRGFILPKYPVVYNDYIWIYKGFYKSPKGNSIPVTLKFSTSSDLIDETMDNAFLQLSIAGKDIDAGGVNLKDPQTILDSLNQIVELGEIPEPKNYADKLARRNLIVSKDGKTFKTKKEWEEDFLLRWKDYIEAHNAYDANKEDPELEQAWLDANAEFNGHYLASVYPSELNYPKEYFKAGNKYNTTMANNSMREDLFNPQEN